MSRKIFVRPLKPNVAADNGARTFLPPRGMVREASPYFERLRQIGAAELLDLPAPGQRVMIRPVAGDIILARGAQEDRIEPWNERLEAQLTDGLISFPEPPPAAAPAHAAPPPVPAAEASPVPVDGSGELAAAAPPARTSEEPAHG